MIVSGSQHFIVPKRILLWSLAIVCSLFGGTLISQHLYNRRVESFLHTKTKTVATSNKQLEQEQAEYRDLFDKLTLQLSEDRGAGKAAAESSEVTKESVVSFHQLATRLLEGLQSMQDLLEEKEFQLWENEGLLEYQEERLMNTEDLETEMTAYINSMAASLRSKDQSLPEGLEDMPYFGLPQIGDADDAMAVDPLELKRAPAVRDWSRE